MGKLKKVIEETAAELPNRRGFLSKVGLASAAGAAVLSNAKPVLAQSGGPSDIDILNFALNLEYLEAEFYTIATTGQTISDRGVPIDGAGTPGPTTGGSLVNLSNSPVFTRDVAIELAFDEQQHVRVIRDAISSMGGVPVAKPAINLNALGIGFGNQAEFLTLSRAFEDVGVTAYAGAAPLIQNKAVLAVAARILGTEAEHVGNIRLHIAVFGIPTTPLDGVDILPPPSGYKFFSTDDRALTQVRTPGQVLYIVYGFKANATAGGFFPNGVNGPINMSSGPA